VDRAVDLYLEEVSAGRAGTPESDRAAKLKAVGESGILGTHVPKDEGERVRSFDRLLRAPDVNRYIVEMWGIAVEDDNPVQRYMRKIDEHAMQGNDPRLSLDASKFALSKMLAPPTQRIQSASVVAHVTRPAEFDNEPLMESRSILPAGQHITKPPAPASIDDVEDEEQD
jgi:hypothetical protein